MPSAGWSRLEAGALQVAGPMSPAPVVLAIDQGTTGSRALVLDAAASVVASAYREFPQYFPAPGWVEHDAAGIWDSVLAPIR